MPPTGQDLALRINLRIVDRKLNMTATNSHMKLAIQADLDRLYRRLPDPKVLGNQLREMIQAESRAVRYGLMPPWRAKGDWYGVVVPNTSDEVDESAIVTTRPTGRKAGRQKEKTQNGND